MKLKISLLGIFVAVALTQAATPKVIGYVPFWAQYSQYSAADIRYPLITHLHYGYVVPDEEGAIALADETDAENAQAIADSCKIRGVKFVLALGGGQNDEAMLANATEEKAGPLADAALAMVQKMGADGISLDWDIQSAEDVPAYNLLAKALQERFSQADPNLIVAASLYGKAELIASHSPEVLNQFQYLTLTVIDEMNDTKSAVEPNCNGSTVVDLMGQYATAGIEKSKLIAVLPFFGKSFAKAKGLGTSFEGVGSGNEGFLSYNELMKKFDNKDYVVTFDEATLSEVAVSELETIVFNGIPSIKAVSEKVMKDGFGGVAGFDLSTDAPQPTVSLLVTIGLVLRPEINYKKVK